MTDPKLEQQARELLAAEYEKAGLDICAKIIREQPLPGAPAIRAIVAALSQQRAGAEGWVLVTTRQLGRWKKAAGEVADYMSRAKVSRHIYAQSELLAAEIHFELAAAPSPEQEK